MEQQGQGSLCVSSHSVKQIFLKATTLYRAEYGGRDGIFVRIKLMQIQILHILINYMKHILLVDATNTLTQ